MYRFFLLILSFFIGILSVSARELPFTDVKKTDIFYDAVGTLYQKWILSDTPDHLFRPNDLMTRDFYVFMAVGIWCKQCEIPSTADIIRYQNSPFVDLTKINPYYYCVAYAEDIGMTQWYPPDTTGKAYCENKSSYTTPPFCAANTITRIEAAAILLRRAKLWDDTLNLGAFERNIDIPDASYYWYGYAKKAIEIGIVQQKTDKKIWQDEKITRGEFAIMAAKILEYTQCKIPAEISVESEIIIQDQNKNIIEQRSFPKWSKDTLVVSTSTGTNWEHKWTLTNPETKETLNGNGTNYPIDGLGCGQWIAEVDTIDPQTKKSVSRSTATIFIECSDQKSTNNMGLTIDANPLVTYIWNPVDFTSTLAWGQWPFVYNWDFWDGSRSNEKNPTHPYSTKWIYPVVLTVTDANGNIVQWRIAIRVTGDKDSDSDGVFDKDEVCPLVYWEKDNKWCPKFGTYTSSLPDSIIKNSCLVQKSETQWLIMGQATCDICPCQNTVTILASLRSCDVVFPTILSPDFSSIYARGGFFLIP